MPCFKRRPSRRAVLEASVGLGLVLAVLLTCRFSSFAAVAASVRADTLRLHVQANSNAPDDQLLKLRVRDAVLEAAGRLFGGEADKAAALEVARASLPQLQMTAEKAVAEAGSTLPVRVYLTNMYFGTTHYADFTLPSGRYDAVRVELGAHAGKNWFCVLYPGLCLPAAEGEAAYPTAGEQQLIEGEGSPYEIRFAALEWWQRVTGGAN